MYEIRNPLSGASLLVYEFLESLKELAGAVQEKDLSAQQLRQIVKSETSRLRELASYMQTQIDKMRGVCDDVLQLEKIQKGKFEYQFSPEGLNNWAKKVAAQSTPLFTPTPGSRRHQQKRKGSSNPQIAKGDNSASQSPVRFEWTLSVALSVRLLLRENPVGVADFARLKQAISNFLSNAKKFTIKGTVQLKFEITLPTSTDEGSKQGTKAHALGGKGKPAKLEWVGLRVSMTDSGAGLSDEDIGKLFRPYGQVRAGELQNGGGTGLGLCICKSFVEAPEGGCVGVESAGRGEGSTFFFQLCVPLLDASHAPKRSEDDLISPPGSPAFSLKSPMRHKNPLNRRNSILSALASCGEDGGKEISPALKAVLTQPLLSIPSSALQSEEADNLDNADCNSDASNSNGNTSSLKDDAKKPVEGPSLTVERSPLRTPPPSLDHPEGADVLLVDDDRFYLMAGFAAIKRLGFSVCTAEDRDEACDLVIAKKAPFCFVLIDRNMARMEGPQAIEKMVAHFSETDKEEDYTSRPFIIGCTGDATPDSQGAFL
uniref:histidine kinase n=1 Tax=Chromera velia CCMP2878 TaxID=1169474 RepID=A0A0G4HW43_9ALVE|eukprot:Cvel_8979.t1-p1 / transcript=Cvel_8979.t1 / gene=Cvel_8979 / organism=Chromera_velia_CCMP2878 / gene_product=Ethylene receptor 1, putative / transcript_product=Ethylene receptor 1, putative / location=Cvel_scaffold506:78402-80027(-) / protein_length=542 / sequence_SO=supercontig / SO=protein_coding / is_pseudo=false